jgi:CelD/BcsL family acetyltransferase involved in cellulose biosynthesis
MRYELKKKKERLNERYRSEVEIFKSPSDDIDLAVNEFINLHERRWRSLGFRSAFDDEHHRDFHFEVAKKLARRGWLRLFFLKVDGRRVAVSFDFNYNKRIHVYLSHAHGPDEIMKRSPGFLIRCIAIERGIAEGMQVYDLLRGNESYKYEELKCTRSENWLIRGVSPSRTSRARFRVFLVREFTLKCLDRLGREYHEFKRFFITKRPSAIAALRYISAQSLLLGGLGRKYVERFFMNNHTAGTSYDDSSK